MSHAALTRLVVSSVWLVLMPSMVLKADASPRFTVQNDTDTKVNVYIFKGDDPFCSFEEKLKTLSAGETDTYGCTGGGKGQCKIQVYADGTEVCKKTATPATRMRSKSPAGKQRC